MQWKNCHPPKMLYCNISAVQCFRQEPGQPVLNRRLAADGAISRELWLDQTARVVGTSMGNTS